ncbi:uncharacterized protein LOC135399723 [Ornithodoros turicata]|uniref:uncharacterized protein LOC135399723 n=1 Tax=Ornithodoros turicata TaxID=34597 RepID=UPI003139ADE2
MSESASLKPLTTCRICDKVFARPSTLRRHIGNVHHVTADLRLPFKCQDCKSEFANLEALRNHAVSKHQFPEEIVERTFDNEEDFKKWKESEETEWQARFVSSTAAKRLADGSVRQYLTCHRSGVYSSTGVGKRRLKSQKSCKIGSHCFASMTVTREGEAEAVKVRYQKCHTGHGVEPQHYGLSSNEKAEIAGKLAEGVSLQAILDSIRDSIAGPVTRLHLVNRRDLHNILKSFNITYSERTNQNDVLSVATWVDSMQPQDNSPVRYFKQQGLCDEKGLFEKDDFALVIMTEPQQHLLSKLGSEKICIDSTHGTTGYDFLLTTLMTVDEYGAGLPCAYLLSNRADTSTMKVFFEAVKASAGSLATKVFMSDDASEFYNAWESVMGPAERRLLCAWHVDHNWRKNLNKLKGQHVQVQVYKTLRLLLECTNVEQFQKLMHQFLCDKTEVIQDFLTYFKNSYATRPEMWAYCYRASAGINTNMYLESGVEHETVTKVHKLLQNAADLLSAQEAAKCSKEPNNKKLVKQLRYHTTKKKWTKKPRLSLSKPTAAEKEMLKHQLNDNEAEVTYIHAGADHAYKFL